MADRSKGEVIELPIEIIREHIFFYAPECCLVLSKGLRRDLQIRLVDYYERLAKQNEATWLRLVEMTFIPNVIPERYLIFSVLIHEKPPHLKLDEEAMDELIDNAIKHRAYGCLASLVELDSKDTTCPAEEIIVLGLERQVSDAIFSNEPLPPVWVFKMWVRTMDDRDLLLATITYELDDFATFNSAAVDVCYQLLKDGWTAISLGNSYARRLLSCTNMHLIQYAVQQYQGAPAEIHGTLKFLAKKHAWDNCRAILSTGRFHDAEIQQMIDNRQLLDIQRAIRKVPKRIERWRAAFNRRYFGDLPFLRRKHALPGVGNPSM